MNKDLIAIFEYLEREKGIKREVVIDAIAESLRAAARKSVKGLGEKVSVEIHPKTGEIAVFRWPPAPEYDFIKRIIGVPGDKISYHHKVLTINGKEMKQTFIEYTTDESSDKAVAKYRENLAGVVHDIYVRPEVPSMDYDITVPDGYYFMMGDNRDGSADSRFWGFVADDYLRGKAFLVWLSWNSKTGGFRWSNIGHFIH